MWQLQNKLIKGSDTPVVLPFPAPFYGITDLDEFIRVTIHIGSEKYNTTDGDVVIEDGNTVVLTGAKNTTLATGFYYARIIGYKPGDVDYVLCDDNKLKLQRIEVVDYPTLVV